MSYAGDNKRLVELAIARQLAQTEIEQSGIDEICSLCDANALHVDALELLKEPLKKDKSLLQGKALDIIARLVETGGDAMAYALASKKWMERLLKVSKGSGDEALQKSIAKYITDWHTRFQNDPRFAEFSAAYAKIQKSEMKAAARGSIADSGSFLQRIGSSIMGRGASADKDKERDQSPLARMSSQSTMRREMSANQKIETMMQNAQADLRSLELGLQDPAMLHSHVVENCKRHQQKIMLLLSTGLEERYTFQLISMYDQLGEYLEIYTAIYQADKSAGGASRTSAPGAPRSAAPTKTKSQDDTTEEDGTKGKKKGKKRAAAAATEGGDSSAGATEDTADTSEDEEVDEETKEDARNTAAELETLKQQVAEAKARRKQVDDEVQKLKTEHNDLKVKIGMAKSGELRKQQKKEALATVAKRTGKQSRQVIVNYRKQVKTLRNMFEALKRDATAYVGMWQNDIAHLSSICEKAAKNEAKGFETLKTLYMNEMKMRKSLYNKIQEFRGNTRIYARARPSERMGEEAVSFQDNTTLLVQGVGPSKLYEVDAAFKPTARSREVFEDAAGMVDCAMDGYNVAMIAYGPSNSGKNYTMFGSHMEPGIFQLTLDKIYEAAAERVETEKITLKISVLEIVNDTIRDLIEPSRRDLQVKTSEDLGCYVDGLTQLDVDNRDVALRAYQKAIGNRDRSDQHKQSSALIVYFLLKSENLQTGGTTSGKLYVMTLPASERQDKMTAQLGLCMERLLQNTKGDQIPFRTTKLTYLLQDTLGGSAKQLFFLCFSPSKQQVTETVNCLTFAFRIRGVILGK